MPRFAALFLFLVNLFAFLLMTREVAAECILFTDGFEAPVVINQRPVITSLPGTITSAEHLYLYQVRAMDADGDALTHVLLGGPTGMTLASGSGQLSWWPGAADTGSHEVRLQVSDGRGGCVRQAYSLTVIADAANQTPVARAGADQSVPEGTLVVLDGNASADADGYIAAWRWEQISGPRAQLADNFTDHARVLTPPVGSDATLTFQLTVTDNRQAEATDTLVLTVTPNLNDGDEDGDGIPDADDAFPQDGADAYDYDGDGLGDNTDDDRDGDGVDNTLDFYPDDPDRSAPPVLSIDTPQNNAVVGDENVLVTGTLNVPWNTGVQINGRLALRGGSPWGSAFALRLPLQSGANNIDVVVTGQSGSQITQTLSVTRNGSASFQLDAAPLRAFAPAEVLFLPALPAGLNVIQADWDFEGDGVVDASFTADFDKPVSHSYASAGLYYPALTLTDDQNQTHRQVLAVSVVDHAAHDQRLKSLWNAMIQALSDRNLGLARSFLLEQSGTGYDQVFYLLLPHMPAIVPGFSLPETVEAGLTHAEYAVGDGTDRVFLVQLIRNALGVWKVEGM